MLVGMVNDHRQTCHGTAEGESLRKVVKDGVCLCKRNPKIQVNENGLRGRSGERGLRAFANSSSLSLLGTRVSELPMAANPMGPLFCCAC
jgi:hypothetical protein